MKPKQTIAALLADFAAGSLAPNEEMARFTRFSLLDWISVGIAGRDEPVAKAARAMALGETGTREAALFGGGRGCARAAALANGATSHALDYDDTHFGHIGHPSVAIMPTALALGEARGVDGQRLFEALVAGLETACRIGGWLGRSHYEAGFHQTGTSGAFGATAAAGRILGLDARAMTEALCLTATRAAGLKSQFGTMGKPLNAGFAAEVGVTSALLAEAGATSAPAAIEDVQGFGPTHAGSAREEAFEGLGQEWVFPRISYKFHACCHGLHAMLEALRSLGPDRPEPGAVEKVTIRTHPRWLAVCNKASPETGLEAKFSYRLTAAMSLSGVDTAALGSYTDEICTRPDIVTLRDRVEVVTDDALSDTEAEVTVDLGGRVLEARHDICAPTNSGEIEGRLREKSRALLGAEKADGIWSDVVSAHEQKSLSGLASRIGDN
ncbi:MmgE/PrpD family protein [Rhodobacteraceae bacterium NNCM2]|nr:MmgE/PrpD family protein [Coraliihabitans acroporae]